LVKKHIPLICIALLLLSGCGGAAPALSPKHPDLEVSIQREACFGSCPVYSLTVSGDGSVTFQGEDYVLMTGTHTSSVSPESIEELVQAIEETGYFDLRNQYTAYEVTDNPYTTTTVTLDGHTKTIRHYHGDRSAPEQLTRFEKTIDRIANVQQWIGR
jgi:hypothetical protein